MDTIASLIQKIRQITGFSTQSDEDFLKLGLLELLCRAGCCHCPGPGIEFLMLDLDQDG